MLSTSDSDLQRFLRNLLLSAKNREDAIEKSQGLKKKIAWILSFFRWCKISFQKKRKGKNKCILYSEYMLTSWCLAQKGWFGKWAKNEKYEEDTQNIAVV